MVQKRLQKNQGSFYGKTIKASNFHTATFSEVLHWGITPFHLAAKSVSSRSLTVHPILDILAVYRAYLSQTAKKNKAFI